MKYQTKKSTKGNTQPHYWFNKKCCVPECYNCSTMGSGCVKEYFDLPAEEQARSRWLKVILAEDREHNMKVCEDHFKKGDIFCDKTNRKKLRINSIPSLKLPKYICGKCLGSKHPNRNSNPWEKICECVSQIVKVVNETRTGLVWTTTKKKALFRHIRRYGELSTSKDPLMVNWPNVINNSNGEYFLKDEGDIKKVWRTLILKSKRVAARKVHGTRLERKIAKFLISLRDTDSQSNQIKKSEGEETMATSDEENVEDLKKKQNSNINSVEEIQQTSREETQETSREVKEDKSCEEKPKCHESDSEDEYYSLEDVEREFGITLKPVPVIISLLSSDESDYEM